MQYVMKLGDVEEWYVTVQTKAIVSCFNALSQRLVRDTEENRRKKNTVVARFEPGISLHR